jgi:hypothetical protein
MPLLNMINKPIAIRMVVSALFAVATAHVSAEELNHHHPKMAKDVDAFHAVLAPLWHARPGPERLPNACAKAEEMAHLARDIRSANATQLLASIGALKNACQSKPEVVDAAFYDVHEAFHHLIDAKPATAKR